MAYQALYRVWRPQQFKDMIGQEVEKMPLPLNKLVMPTCLPALEERGKRRQRRFLLRRLTVIIKRMVSRVMNVTPVRRLPMAP